MLVAGDHALIASRVARISREAGCGVAGPPAATLGAGPVMARREEDRAPDAAALNIDLRGEPAYLLPDALEARKVPALFLTGHGECKRGTGSAT